MYVSTSLVPPMKLMIEPDAKNEDRFNPSVTTAEFQKCHFELL